MLNAECVRHFEAVFRGTLEAVKTTLDISKETLKQVKSLAAREEVPMREVLERGMWAYVAWAGEGGEWASVKIKGFAV